MIEQDLRRMDEAVRTCERCELHEQRTHTVFGMGNPFSEIMVIGEGPGEEEDHQGVPFVGKSGQLLDKILAAGGFSRDENVYIANIVKCRPPGNREPSPEERTACLPYLLGQIRLICPSIIILLGSTALKGLLDPEGKITRVRGKWQMWNDIWVMPTYHPSALLRNPDLKKDTWEDIKEVVRKYREIVDPKHMAERI